MIIIIIIIIIIQGGSNMTGTDLYKRTHKSVPVIFEPPCNNNNKLLFRAAAFWSAHAHYFNFLFYAHFTVPERTLSFVVLVRPSVWNNSAPTFKAGGCRKNVLRKLSLVKI